jgi:hypothetical protein
LQGLPLPSRPVGCGTGSPCSRSNPCAAFIIARTARRISREAERANRMLTSGSEVFTSEHLVEIGAGYR